MSRRRTAAKTPRFPRAARMPWRRTAAKTPRLPRAARMPRRTMAAQPAQPVSRTRSRNRRPAPARSSAHRMRRTPIARSARMAMPRTARAAWLRWMTPYPCRMISRLLQSRKSLCAPAPPTVRKTTLTRPARPARKTFPNATSVRRSRWLTSTNSMWMTNAWSTGPRTCRRAKPSAYPATPPRRALCSRAGTGWMMRRTESQWKAAQSAAFPARPSRSMQSSRNSAMCCS